MSVTNKLYFIMYADDTSVYFNLEDFDLDCVEAEITNEPERACSWLKLNKLSLNTQINLCN